MDSTLLSCSSAAAQLANAVQQAQLTAALSQLSSVWARQAHELAAQLSGLTARLELLEGAAARQEQVVLQVRSRRWLELLVLGTGRPENSRRLPMVCRWMSRLLAW